MMARRREVPLTAPVVESVPAALPDHDDPAWRSPGAFAAWCRANLQGELPTPPGTDVSPFGLFLLAADDWAAHYRLTLPGYYGGTDWHRLAGHGIHRPRRLRVVQ